MFFAVVMVLRTLYYFLVFGACAHGTRAIHAGIIRLDQFEQQYMGARLALESNPNDESKQIMAAEAAGNYRDLASSLLRFMDMREDSFRAEMEDIKTELAQKDRVSRRFTALIEAFDLIGINLKYSKTGANPPVEIADEVWDTAIKKALDLAIDDETASRAFFKELYEQVKHEFGTLRVDGPRTYRSIKEALRRALIESKSDGKAENRLEHLEWKLRMNEIRRARVEKSLDRFQEHAQI